MTALTTSATVDVTVNGRAYSRTVPARLLLTDFLREELGLTGTHVGCEHGDCGACNSGGRRLVRGCLTLTAQVNGRAGTTIEAIMADGRLHPVQQALLDENGLQWGSAHPAWS